MRKWLSLCGFLTLIAALAWRSPAAAPTHVAVVVAAPTVAPPRIPQPTVAPTTTPQPWTFPAGTTLAGQPVGGMTAEQAESRLRLALEPFQAPLQLTLESRGWTVRPEELGVRVSAAELVAQARELLAGRILTQPLQLPLELAIDDAALDRAMALLQAEIDRPPVLWLDSTTATFALTPGLALDVPTATERVVARLRSPDANRRVALPTLVVSQPARPSAAEIEAALAPAIERFNQGYPGVVGIYVANLDGELLFGRNIASVFSGVSVMKISIMLQTYISSPELSADQRDWLELMMVDSDNKAANSLLAQIGVAEEQAEDGLAGIRIMNATLAELGLHETAMVAPYESVEYLLERGIELTLLSNRGEEPFTDADPYIRTTPADMGWLMVLIGQCAEGRGLLLERYQGLSQPRCREMVDVMARNADRTKIVAGLPANLQVAHKSGWADDIRADVALVGSGPDTLVVSLFVWGQVKPKNLIPNELADPLMASLTRTVYSAFFPTSGAIDPSQ